LQNVYKTDLQFIATQAVEKEEENDHFRQWLKNEHIEGLDDLVHSINDEVSAAVDCTQCGNCCKTLIINVTAQEATQLAAHLHMPEAAVKEKYIEESVAGNMYINTMPCHFLADKKCSIYTNRFTECRDFPHLHKPGFQQRMLGTLMHYGGCPIVYNVVEELKGKVGFKNH